MGFLRKLETVIVSMTATGVIACSSGQGLIDCNTKVNETLESIRQLQQSVNQSQETHIGALVFSKEGADAQYLSCVIDGVKNGIKGSEFKYFSETREAVIYILTIKPNP